MRVLISRTDRIGDVILSLPVASCLKRHRFEVFYLVRSYTAPLLLYHPDIHGSLIIDGECLKSLVNHLKQFKFDAVIALYPTPFLAFTFYLSKIPIRIGTAYRYYSLLFNKRVFIHRKKCEKHEVFYNLEMVEPLGVEPLYSPPVLYLTDDEKKWGIEVLSDIKRPLVAIHPGSGGSADNWSYNHYELLTRLLINEGYGIVITGKKGETETFQLLSSENILDLRDRTSLRELMAVIYASDLFVSASTGPMHIASALGIPTVSLFSSRAPINPKRWGPLHKKAKIITSNFVEEIPVKKVFLVIKDILETGFNKDRIT